MCTSKGTIGIHGDFDSEIVVEGGLLDDGRHDEVIVMEARVGESVAKVVEDVELALLVAHISIRLVLHVVVHVQWDRLAPSVPRVRQSSCWIRGYSGAHC